jgi:integrase/recombinase XerD
LPEGRLTVRHAKNGRSREIPLHPTTVAALDRYVRARDDLCPHPKDPAAFFLSGGGGRPSRQMVEHWFDRLRRATGLDHETLGRRARLHDVRHSYVLRTLIGWYRDGSDIDAQLPLLSTVLGHVHPADTYWYFEAAPELLTLACERLEQTWEGSSTYQPTNAQARMPLSWERSRRRRPRQMRHGKGRR